MLALRLPGYNWWIEMEFVYDTGANMMTIFESDIEALMGPQHPGTVGVNCPPIPLMGSLEITTNNGNVTRPIYELEATVIGQAGKRITPWTRVPCHVNPGEHPAEDFLRLDGPILRYLLYVSSIPNNTGNITASTNKLSIHFGKSAAVPVRDRIPDYSPTTMWQSLTAPAAGAAYQTIAPPQKTLVGQQKMPSAPFGMP